MPLHLEPGARVEVSLPILPATCWPLVWPPASSYSSLLSLCLWDQMGSVGLGCPPQKPTMVPAIAACSRPYLLTSWKRCQQGLFIPGMVQLPFLPCLQMLTLSKVNLWSLLGFFLSWDPYLVLSWSSNPPSLSSQFVLRPLSFRVPSAHLQWPAEMAACSP